MFDKLIENSSFLSSHHCGCTTYNHLLKHWSIEWANRLCSEWTNRTKRHDIFTRCTHKKPRGLFVQQFFLRNIQTSYPLNLIIQTSRKFTDSCKWKSISTIDVRLEPPIHFVIFVHLENLSGYFQTTKCLMMLHTNDYNAAQTESHVNQRCKFSLCVS